MTQKNRQVSNHSFGLMRGSFFELIWIAAGPLFVEMAYLSIGRAVFLDDKSCLAARIVHIVSVQ